MDEIPEDYKQELKKRGFLLTRKIARGGFGRVFEAQQERFERPVAVKFFDVIHHRTEDHDKRFEREAQLLAAVNSPHIPYVVTAGQMPNAGVLYYVMQYVKGETLKSAMKRRKPLELPRMLAVSRQVAAALRAAHVQRVIHRDVSPSNIMVSPGPSEHIFLIDFGLGVALRDSSGWTRLTGERHVMGTQEYIAPELRLGAVNTTPKADVYSLGVVMFEMLSGHTNVAPQNIERDLGRHPSGLRSLIASCCKEDPESRPAASNIEQELASLQLQPTVRKRDEPQMALCPNVRCPQVEWHHHGDYFMMPAIDAKSTCVHCEDCGTKLVYECAKCGSGFVGKRFCGTCGSEFWQGSHCPKCNVPLYRNEVGTDLSSGCAVCGVKQTSLPYDPGDYDPGDYGPGEPGDDDIPF